MKPFAVAFLVGSLRRDSINRRLAEAVIRVSPKTLSFRPIPLDALPMYNGDLESERPEAVNSFTQQCARAEAFLFVMPEYNRSLPAVLKNAIDWGSKPGDRNVWRDKPVAMTGTSPGTIGTAVGQQHLRQILGILGASVLGGEAYITFKPDLFDSEGSFSAPSTSQFMVEYMQRFSTFTRKLLAP